MVRFGLLIVALLWSSFAFGQDEITLDAGRALDVAKLRYKRDLAGINEKMLGLFDIEIERIAEKGDLKSVKALQQQKDAFKENGSFPNLAAMQPNIVKYVEARKRLNAALTKAFDQAVIGLTKERRFAEAEAAESEGAEFAEAEKQLLSGNRKAKAEIVDAEKKGNEAERFAGRKSLRAETFLPTWSEQFTTAVDAIADLETSTQRDKAHRELITKTDADLRTCQVTVTLTIRDVRFENKKYYLDFEAYEHAGEIRSLDTFLRFINTAELTREEALKLKPGDKCVLSGTPRFGLHRNGDGDGELTLLTLEHRTPVPYRLYLVNCKLSFQRK